ncbi:PepSY domain-containing protein [Pontivivens insulae]|uniref:PepSY domain-containing protein n=1 Tax=Pontivivens insulae TaxID=1639689 RepID=A0A2R8AEZ2_9RHOB|nr:PepSY domain-containing protein [Pontivivens insulae]RED12058.1 YpeB-like protein with putative protease inhibitory function [Pontivivens insulae]SPF30814.1 hypothetical protein POI8812_03158 [Pontivivens insulae]
MTTLAKSALFAALFAPGIALAQVDIGDRLGTTENAIRASLQSQGYDVLEVEREGDEIEFEAVRDGTYWEIEVSAVTGMVVGIELDEDDDAS